MFAGTHEAHDSLVVTILTRSHDNVSSIFMSHLRLISPKQYETDSEVRGKEKVRPLPPRRKPISLNLILKSLGVGVTLSTAGLLGYRLFVFTPQYKGPESDLQGKTIVITEPTNRTSRDLLRGLAERGAQLILTSSSVDSCHETRSKLLRSTKINSSLVDCRRLELDSLTSVRRFAAGILADYPKLNRVVIQSPSCVSGIVAGKKRLTHDGFEQELGKNYFASYLLCRLLFDRLNESEDGRLILVVDTDAAEKAQTEASESGSIKLPIHNLNWEDEKSFTPEKAYQRSQWFMQLFADEFNRRNPSKSMVMIANPRVTRGSAPPQPGDTSESSWYNIFKIFDGLFDMTAGFITRRTSGTPLYCCIAQASILNESSTANPSGIIQAPVYQDLRQVKPNQIFEAKSQSAAQHLWLISERWTRMDTHPTPFPIPIRDPHPSLTSTSSATNPNVQTLQS